MTACVEVFSRKLLSTQEIEYDLQDKRQREKKHALIRNNCSALNNCGLI